MKKIILFLAFLCLPLSARAESVEHRFRVEVGMFEAAKGKISYEMSPKSYDIQSEVTTDNFLAKIIEFTAQYRTRGKITKNQFVASDYTYKSVSGSDVREKHLYMDEGGMPIKREMFRKGKFKHVDIQKPEFDFDAPDTQTVFLMLVHQFKDFNFCEMKKTVYDGKKHYIMTFRDEGEDKPEDMEVPVSGKVWKCSFRIDTLDSENEDKLWRMSAEKPVHLWVAKDEKSGAPYLVKIQIDSTPLGTLKAYTNKIVVKE